MPEIEAKFSLGDPTCVEALLHLQQVGPLRVAGRRTVALTDVYYDTPGREVAAGHASVRERTADGVRLFTVKTGAIVAGTSKRGEVEEPAGERELVPWLVSVAAAGRIHLPFAPEALEPVLRIHNRREVLDLEGDD